MKLLFVCTLLLASASLAAAQSSAHWSYDGKTGPIVWSKLDPSYQACNKGHEQSPIDLRGAHLNKALEPIEFHYISGGVTVVNTGHAIQVNVHPGSYIVAGGVRYDLVQFHFHTPSEEAIHGKFADMSLHLVHKSADGKLAVVAVRFLQDRDIPNALLATLTGNLPKAEGKEVTITEMINPGGFLPADRVYYTYTGSLTAPPCTEGVRWFIFAQEMPMSRGQFRALGSLFRMNARPLQEAHGRRIEVSQ
jgi:carbonic anhydrase